MSYTPDKLVSFATRFEQISNESLEKSAKKKEKVDPKAKVRNRGSVCVPAEQAKDKKDHFPINDEAQARNALARVHQYSSAPDWYSGSLKGLQALVARKVKAKYPKIDVGGKDSKKKSSYYQALLSKFAQRTDDIPPPDPADIVQTVPEQTIVGEPPAPKPKAPARPAQSATTTNLLIEAQKGLKQLGFKGKSGKDLDPDGKLGPETNFAIAAYIEKNKGRIPEGFAQAGDALYTMIARDATGENKTTAFDHKTTNDALNAASALLLNFQSQSAQGQITYQNAATVKQQIAQSYEQVKPYYAGILAALQDNRSSEQEKTLAGQLKAKADKLVSDIGAWNKYLDGLTNPAARM
jgi:hypothetical protein